MSYVINKDYIPMYDSEDRKETTMSENYIVINGKKAELTPEQLKALGLETEIKSPFERETDQKYYIIDIFGNVFDSNDMGLEYDKNVHKVANYCTDREMIQQQAYRETLNRLLWRYSMEHKGNEIDWNNRNSRYRIAYSYDRRRWIVFTSTTERAFGAVYFATKTIANNAIKEIIEPFMAEHPDFKF